MKEIINNKKIIILLFLLLLFLWGCNTAPPINDAPTITSSPVITATVGVPYTYDVEAIDPDGDILTYTLTESPTGMTINSSAGLVTWTPSAEGDYDVTVQVSDGELSDTQSFTITVSITGMTLSPPTGLSASDGDSPYPGSIRITWNPVIGAVYYQVYRSDSLDGTKASISGWQMSTTYIDGLVTPEVTYYYWVKAATSPTGDDASDYSEYDTGWASSEVSFVLSPPSGVNASVCLGCSNTKIKIIWHSVSGATYYQVYRADSLTGTRTPISSWQAETEYYDTSLIPGVTYYYWVKAAASSTGYNASNYSASAHGIAGICSGHMDPPTNVEASDSYFTKIRIAWDYYCPDAYFQVYRANSLEGTRTPVSSWQTGMFPVYEDTSVIPEITYYYWVRAALNSSGDYASSYSDYDTGKRLIYSKYTIGE